MAKLVRRWHKIDDLERYVRRTIYNVQLSRWRRRARLREHPVKQTPEQTV